MNERIPLECDAVDALDAAFALEAVTPDERRAIAGHLERCPQPHERLRSFLGAGVALAAALEPVAPSHALRERLMRSVAATAQDHRKTARRFETPTPRRARDAGTSRGWLGWLSPGWARRLAATSLAAAAALAAWNVTLQAQLADSDRITRAVAEARAIYPVTGDAGQGLLLDTPDGPRFLTARLETPPSGSLYVLWLIGEDGVPVDVGVVTGAEGVALVPLDEDLAEYTTFAVTVETERVEAPTTAPVLAAAIGGAESGS